VGSYARDWKGRFFCWGDKEEPYKQGENRGEILELRPVVPPVELTAECRAGHIHGEYFERDLLRGCCLQSCCFYSKMQSSGEEYTAKKERGWTFY
jgi:hypothetical protein